MEKVFDRRAAYLQGELYWFFKMGGSPKNSLQLMQEMSLILFRTAYLIKIYIQIMGIIYLY
jgi:hypothetical protein